MSGKPALRVSRGIDSLVRDAALRQVKRKAASLADAVSQEADRIMQKELVIDRDPKRRKHGRHAYGSVVVDVDQAPNGKVRLTAHSLAPKAKVNALESGSRPHIIRAVNGPFLKFPSTVGTGRATEVGRGGSIVRLEPAGKSPTSRARKQGYSKGGKGGKGKWVQTPEVNHPGNRPYHIMKRALERVVRRSLRG